MTILLAGGTVAQPPPGQQHLGGADGRDDRLPEEVPPQDQQLHRDPGHQQQAGQVPGASPGRAPATISAAAASCGTATPISNATPGSTIR